MASRRANNAVNATLHDTVSTAGKSIIASIVQTPQEYVSTGKIRTAAVCAVAPTYASTTAGSTDAEIAVEQGYAITTRSNERAGNAKDCHQ